MRVERDGVSFEVVDGGIGATFWERYYATGWETEQAWVLDQVPSGGVFVDLGAWIGPWSLPAAARGLRVVAYEPDRAALAELLANAARNPGFALDVHGKAVVAAGDSLVLRSQADVWGGSNSGRWATGTVTDTVPAVTLDGVLAEHRPAFVKMDVEGDELDLLPIVAEAGVPCHVSLHGPLARLAGDDADFGALRPWFARYGRLIVDGIGRRVKASRLPYASFCSITCLDPLQ